MKRLLVGTWFVSSWLTPPHAAEASDALLAAATLVRRQIFTLAPSGASVQ
jgi:hypothetical protein